MSRVPGGEDELVFARAITSGDPRTLTQSLGGYDSHRATAAVINDLQASRPDSIVLIDGLLNGTLQLFIDDPTRLVTDPNRDHALVLEDPVDRVNYILTRDPNEVLPSALLKRFPTLYRDGAPWASYVTDIPEGRLRLFRVLSTAEQAQGVQPILPPRS